MVEDGELAFGDDGRTVSVNKVVWSEKVYAKSGGKSSGVAEQKEDYLKEKGSMVEDIGNKRRNS
jgi:hypothetical protein